ncbi:MAG: PIG-L family deacetylase [Gemmatimonadota bacterium]
MWSDRARALLRRLLLPPVEAGFGAVAALAGAYAARTPDRPWSRGGSRVVIVAAHPDDETLGAGGAAVLHVRAGDHVTIVIVTDGGASRAGGLGRAAMVAERAAELRTAVAALGVAELLSLGLPEGAWRAADIAACEPALDRADVVYAPSCIDYHPEHVAVAAAIAERVRPSQLVRVCQVGVPLTARLVNRVADTSAVAAQTARAAAAYRTQAVSVRTASRLARYQARFHGVAAAEVFWELDGAAYRSVMRAGDWRAGSSPFRGIRVRPLTDALAFSAGWRERRRLLAVATEARAVAAEHAIH